MPTIPEFFSFCSEYNDYGAAKECDLIPGWHVNKEGMIDSGVGLPLGHKIQLKSIHHIENPLGGSFSLEFALKNLQSHEFFRVGINGETVVLSQSTEEKATKFISNTLPKGSYSLDIALISDPSSSDLTT